LIVRHLPFAICHLPFSSVIRHPSRPIAGGAAGARTVGPVG
jgi:hypothetical protein